jgi:hypothetical protein
MNRKRLTRALNEWMRRYTEAPDQFAREWETVGEFLGQTKVGGEPSYGHSCTEYLHQLDLELTAADQVAALKAPVLLIGTGRNTRRARVDPRKPLRRKVLPKAPRRRKRKAVRRA